MVAVQFYLTFCLFYAVIYSQKSGDASRDHVGLCSMEYRSHFCSRGIRQRKQSPDGNKTLSRSQTNPKGHRNRQMFHGHFQLHVIRRAARKTCRRDTAVGRDIFNPTGRQLPTARCPPSRASNGHQSVNFSR